MEGLVNSMEKWEHNWERLESSVERLESSVEIQAHTWAMWGSNVAMLQRKESVLARLERSKDEATRLLHTSSLSLKESASTVSSDHQPQGDVIQGG